MLERAFAALSSALDRTGVPYMMVGGVAVIAHGVKRLTTDVDAVVQGNAMDFKVLLRTLARAQIAPRGMPGQDVVLAFSYSRPSGP